MSDQIQFDSIPHAPRSIIVHATPPLPSWLARRLLRKDETITWVRGPRFSPPWEPFVTHSGIVFLTMIVAGGLLVVGSGIGMTTVFVAFAGLMVLGSIFVVGISAGYFTRLVVTDRRVVIIQGYEVCRSWSIDQLPPRLIRYSKHKGDKLSRTIDVDALKLLIGGESEQFVDKKAILAFGKELERIKIRGNGQP